MQIYDKMILKNPIKIITAFDNSSFISAFRLIEMFCKTHYLIGYVRYEAKDIFLGQEVNSLLPLLYFEVFENFEQYIPKHTDIVYLNPKPKITFEHYRAAIERIKHEIAYGNTYEVNYTFDFDIDFQGEYLNLYEYLLSLQPTPYNAFIQNKYETILSFSPELFFEIQGKHILTKPMKGTVKRNVSNDEKLIQFLKTDVKNLSENVMIVDLLRNDLGRISKTGSVEVTKLFEVETHPTFHAMTSTIEADLLDNIGLWDIFKSIFPCGSVTGAPKISTMRIINEVECGNRGVYCGAIGFLSPEKITFSVPIRILQTKSEGGLRYRVGGAIVWDSSVEEEWLEAFTKTRFLNSDFKIIETFKSDSPLFDKHIARMKNTANHFGFPFDMNKIPTMPVSGIVRILLDKIGHFEIENKTLQPCLSNKVRIAAQIVNSSDDFLQHKTTYRPYFNVDYVNLYDELFFNEKGELTQGSRTNIMLQLNGKFYTPPVKCGLLNGILRQNLLDERKCTEKILYKQDLLTASAIYCINSLRGIKKVQLV